MAAKGKAAKAAGSAAAAKTTPYVQRIIQDEELRDNVRAAYQAGRDAYNRLNNGKAPTKALLEDKKLQKNLQEAATSLRDATQALQEGPKRKRKGGIGRLLVLAVVGTGVALGVSEGLRNKVLDALFGKEEEFEYTSTTAPPTPAPSAS
jgi:hypothetical protein